MTRTEADPTTSTGAERPLRRDAAENRDRLLAAASRVFDTQGLDASVTDIARAAGVGMGTLYRRFPTKAALIDALVSDILAAIIAMAQDAAGSPDGTGLERFLEAASAYQAAHTGCLPRLWNTDHDMVKTARRLIRNLLTDAQRHHRIRADLTSTDLTMAMFSLRGVLETTLPVAPGAWQRHLDLLIAGMRPAPEDLPHRPLSQAHLDKILMTPARPGAPGIHAS
jgi:AcrR family transcriptional regulator